MEMKGAFPWAYLAFIAKALALAALTFGHSSCALLGKKLTSQGIAFAPQVAWNGSDFGIAHLYRSTSGSALELRTLMVESDGRIIKGP